MRRYSKHCFGIIVALLFMGITFPELVFTDDAVKVVDENGEEVTEFSELPGNAIEHIKELYDSAQEGTLILRTKLSLK